MSLHSVTPEDIMFDTVEQWEEFAKNNHDAIVEAAGSIEHGYALARNCELRLGGGAAPTFYIGFRG